MAIKHAKYVYIIDRYCIYLRQMFSFCMEKEEAWKAFIHKHPGPAGKPTAQAQSRSRGFSLHSMLDRRLHLILPIDFIVAQSVVATQCLEAQNTARATLTWSVRVVLRRALHPRTPHASGAPRKA